MNVLVTGGAGFVGSHLVDALVTEGHRVKVYDSLTLQVHTKGELPGYLNKEAEFIAGDIRDRDSLLEALKGVNIVFHKASVVGVGQSMYEVERYMSVNTVGTANLLDILVNEKHSVEKLIVAASMSEYGEGAYECADCGAVYPRVRSEEQLQQGDWEMKCPNCQKTATPRSTSEDKPLTPTSIYAISKKDQEDMSLCIGHAYNIPVVALRYFNIYGTRQSLSNPYTGVMAIFSSRIRSGNPPVIFEDGLQSRDFVCVSDIVQANLLAMNSVKADYQIFNVGTGIPTTIKEVADILIASLNADMEPIVTHKFRKGDIRHCYADISKIQDVLKYQPNINFEDGVRELVSWVKEEQDIVDGFEKAVEELEKKKLTV